MPAVSLNGLDQSNKLAVKGAIVHAITLEEHE
jgi:hypothetical protein